MLDWFWMGFIIQKCVIFGTSHPKETHTYSSDCKRSWRKGATMRKESICWKNSDILAQSGGQKVSLNGWWKESSQVATFQNFILGRYTIWQTFEKQFLGCWHQPVENSAEFWSSIQSDVVSELCDDFSDCWYLVLHCPYFMKSYE